MTNQATKRSQKDQIEEFRKAAWEIAGEEPEVDFDRALGHLGAACGSTLRQIPRTNRKRKPTNSTLGSAELRKGSYRAWPSSYRHKFRSMITKPRKPMASIREADTTVLKSCYHRHNHLRWPCSYPTSKLIVPVS